MERMFLIGAVACLVVSWFYILSLKTKVRDCMAYIQNRIDRDNRVLDGSQSSPDGGRDLKRTGSSWRLGREETTMPVLGKATMDGKPKLILGGANSPQPLHYLCSHCLQPFYLPGNQPPKEAVAELLQYFGKHVEREHLALAGDSNPSPQESDKE
ncbi:MAG: hypothetical protein ABSF46_25720 [Terriglobia bacterium]|jgi:hypothetical protein